MGTKRNPYLRVRESLGVTQAAMAEQVGITRSSWGQLEANLRDPSRECLSSIWTVFKPEFEALGIELEELL